MKAGLLEGRWMWGAPIGYLRPAGSHQPSLIPDPATAHLVQMAFTEYAGGGKSKREVWDELTDLGLGRSGKPLSIQSFGEMLRNPIYKGRVRSKTFDFEGPGDFEPLVSDQLWERVHQVDTKYKGRASKRVWDNPDFPLRRSECSTPLTGSWSTGRSKKYPYYRCPKTGCGAVNVRREKLDEEFQAFLESLSIRDDAMRLLSAVVTDSWTTHIRDLASRRSNLDRRIGGLEAKRTRLVEAFVYSGSIDKATYDIEKGRLDDQLESLSRRLDEYSNPRIDLRQALQREKSVLGDLTGFWNRLKPMDRPAFLRALFPDGISYSNTSIGTGELPWILWPSRILSEEHAGWAVPTRFELAFPA
ncbi:MAG: recombinase family protein [Acidobacteria bacterium]|nr:recombinase family protein [Acidobacteriota bacterium]